MRTLRQRNDRLEPISFVVRLWLERRAVADGPEWRFQARHIQSGVDIHGRHLGELLTFIERQAGTPGPSCPHEREVPDATRAAVGTLRPRPV